MSRSRGMSRCRRRSRIRSMCRSRCQSSTSTIICRSRGRRGRSRTAGIRDLEGGLPEETDVKKPWELYCHMEGIKQYCKLYSAELHVLPIAEVVCVCCKTCQSRWCLKKSILKSFVCFVFLTSFYVIWRRGSIQDSDFMLLLLFHHALQRVWLSGSVEIEHVSKEWNNQNKMEENKGKKHFFWDSDKVIHSDYYRLIRSENKIIFFNVSTLTYGVALDLQHNNSAQRGRTKQGESNGRTRRRRRSSLALSLGNTYCCSEKREKDLYCYQGLGRNLVAGRKPEILHRDVSGSWRWEGREKSNCHIWRNTIVCC